MEKKALQKGQRKFRNLKDQSPIFFLETFESNTKTHYIVSSQFTLYLGYMQRCIFNQITTYGLNSPVTSYTLFQDTLYFGLRNGSIVSLSLEHAYNQIPYSKIESVDGKAILGISVEDDSESKELVIYTISGNSSLRMYRQCENGFKLAANISIQRKISKVVSKALSSSSSEQCLPTFMISLKQYLGYPILLTNKEILKLIQKQVAFDDLLAQREEIYLQDEKVCSTLTTMDLNAQKMVVALGYSDGTIEILKIEKEEERECFIMIPELKVAHRDGIVNLSLINDHQCSYLSYVSEVNFTGLNYESRSNPFSKIKVQKSEKGKEITVSRWTKEKYFIVGSISTEDKNRYPRIYCIEQDIKLEQ